MVDSKDIQEPLAKTIGVLWDEVAKAGMTDKALEKFEAEMRALRILVGHTSGPFAQMVMLNHIQSIKRLRYENQKAKETLEGSSLSPESLRCAKAGNETLQSLEQVLGTAD